MIRRQVLAALAAASALALTSCQPAQQAAEPTSPPEGAPTGIIALGHSGLTGANADPGRQGQDARDQSWATGDSPEVESIYLRMIAEDPTHEGHVANTAVGGAHSRTLAAQAASALEQVPAPALAVIQTVDNDIRCDGTDAEHVEEFGENVRAALQVISETSPDTRIVVVGQRGRPAMLATHFPVVAEPPAPGTESCEFVNADGEWVHENAEYLTGIIEAYEAEQERVCAEFPSCVDDGGANATFEDKEEYLAGGDGNHLTTRGQAATAALIWPVVAEVLGY